MNLQRFFWPAFAGLILAVIAGFLWVVVIPQFGLISDSRSNTGASTRNVSSDVLIPSEERTEALAFRIQTASFGDGKIFDLATADGDVVVIFFMASWCTTYVPEARALKELHAAYRKRGLRVLVVDIDPRSTERALARFRVIANKGEYLWALDTQQTIVRSYGVRTLDATIIIDRDGRIAYRDAFPTDYERLDDAVRGLI
tara:strand:- start:2769 stop:3368 length:600 start_codon:yes stop_codon:yes gene_type:complete